MQHVNLGEMPHPNRLPMVSLEQRVQFAREKLLERERAMNACLHSGVNDNSEYVRQLAVEIKIARDELLDQLIWAHSQPAKSD